MAQITITVDDEALSRAIQEEAARRRTTPSKLVSQAVREWLESQEDAELLPEIEVARREWKEQGGQSASEFFRQLREGWTESR